MRLLINRYGDMIWIDDLYNKYKVVLNIKNAREMSDSNKNKEIEKFKTWIETLELSPEFIDIYRTAMYELLKKRD